VDVDRFKIVNDSLGNVAGDRLLVQIADRLLAALQRDDGAVSSSGALRTTALRDERSILARLGGDKFTILLDHIRNASEGIRVAERVQQSIQAPFVIDNQDVFITASIGIAFSGTGYSEAEDMLGDANTAMTRAKTLGKARYEMCDPSMHSAAAGRLRLETDLHRATERGEFRFHYQPVVSLRDFCVTGFEALVRWQRPAFGLVTPDEFISVAEDTGLILWIGNWILHEACSQMRTWNLQYSRNPAFTVAVNISARQFAQMDLANQITQMLRDSGLAATDLKLEVTESVIMSDGARTARVLSELKTLGVRLCIDDFGTGY
jgi:predicted signal transduction protein with EAL and GGDEF domain